MANATKITGTGLIQAYHAIPPQKKATTLWFLDFDSIIKHPIEVYEIVTKYQFKVKENVIAEIEEKIVSGAITGDVKLIRNICFAVRSRKENIIQVTPKQMFQELERFSRFTSKGFLLSIAENIIQELWKVSGTGSFDANIFYIKNSQNIKGVFSRNLNKEFGGLSYKNGTAISQYIEGTTKNFLRLFRDTLTKIESKFLRKLALETVKRQVIQELNESLIKDMDKVAVFLAEDRPEKDVFNLTDYERELIFLHSLLDIAVSRN